MDAAVDAVSVVRKLWESWPGDSIVDDAERGVFAESERIALIEQIQDHVIDSAYTIPLLLDTQIFAVAPHIHDFGNAANSVPWFYDT